MTGGGRLRDIWPPLRCLSQCGSELGPLVRGSLVRRRPGLAAPSQLSGRALDFLRLAVLCRVIGAFGHGNRWSDKDGGAPERMRKLSLVPGLVEHVRALECNM